MVRLLISKIIFDSEVYPRELEDWRHVEKLKQSIKAGAKLPPIKIASIDGRTNVLIDGLHRLRAFQALQKQTISVKDLGQLSFVEAFVEAVKSNVTHGSPLSFHERLLAYKKLKDEGWTIDKIQGVIYIPKLDLARYVSERIKMDATGKEVVLKAPLKHLQDFSASMVEEDQVLLASSTQLHILKQLILILKNGWLEKSKPILLLLKELNTLIKIQVK